MKLSDVMNRNVTVITGDKTVREAAQKMSDLDVGSLPVCENDRIVGFLTDRDIVVRCIGRGENPDEMCAKDAMTSKVKWCYEDETVEEAAKKMSDCQIQRLVVVDRDKKLVGIVSLSDLTRDHEDEETVTHTIEEIKAPTKPSAVGTSAQQQAH